MCFDVDSQPPITPLQGVSVRTEELVLSAVDGTRFSAFAAHSDAATPAEAAIVIMPDVRGLFSFYRNLAQRFAEAGVEAIAIDYFGRTAGLDPRDDSFDYMPHVMQTRLTPSAWMSPRPSRICARCQEVGHGDLYRWLLFWWPPFVFAGCQSPRTRGRDWFLWVADATPGGHRGADSADRRIRVSGARPLWRRRPGHSPTSIDAFDEALTNRHIDHELIVYPNAPHSFFDRKQEEFQQESTDAWQHILSFIAAHTPARDAGARPGVIAVGRPVRHTVTRVLPSPRRRGVGGEVSPYNRRSTSISAGNSIRSGSPSQNSAERLACRKEQVLFGHLSRLRIGG